MNAHYDLTLIDNPEVACAVLFSAVFNRFHRDIVTNDLVGRIAVDFPNATKNSAVANVGNVVRLYGAKNDLETMKQSSLQWRGLQGRFRLSEIVVAEPGEKRQRWVRTRPHSFTLEAIERLVRRRVKRMSKNTETPDELRIMLQGKDDEWKRALVQTPHIHVTSFSTGCKFPLFFQRAKTGPASELEKLNSYGLCVQ